MDQVPHHPTPRQKGRTQHTQLEGGVTQMHTEHPERGGAQSHPGDDWETEAKPQSDLREDAQQGLGLWPGLHLTPLNSPG